MGVSGKLKKIFRGSVPLADLPREALRRSESARRQKVERGEINGINALPARLAPPFDSFSHEELLTQFRTRNTSFFPFDEIHSRTRLAKLQSELFPEETDTLIASADAIVSDSAWELAGFGTLDFKGENVWRRDPLGDKDWGLEFHADVELDGGDADVRILWELNRFGHAITLARAFAVTSEEAYAETFFSQIEDWTEQNPYGRGANWTCAMEAALRSINLLAAFDIFRHSETCTAERLVLMLRLFDHHGRFIFDNLEFSYVSTSNHYLSDLVGLFWIGTLMPELKHAAEWQEFALAELVRDLDKQILPDGANFESSTGYHKFVSEMLLYSLILADKNGVEIPGGYRAKVLSMLDYIFGIIRHDGRVPLIGDADGSQIVPVVKRDANDTAYLLALGAVIFDEPRFKASARPTPELLWVLGERGPEDFRKLALIAEPQRLAAFPDAGSYVMRDDDFYLHFNVNDAGLNGRGSHAHNDALSIEVSAYDVPFIVDPGSYVYNLDREERHRFRSTAYHSTLEIDGIDQNTTDASTPFIIGNEANPRVLHWQILHDGDQIAAEHYGYRRLKQPVTHRRTVSFLRDELYWTIEDNLTGKGTHDLCFRFHFAEYLDLSIPQPKVVAARHKIRGTEIHLFALDEVDDPIFEPNFVSRSYGGKLASQSVCWRVRSAVPCTFHWMIMPIMPGIRY